MLGGRGTQVWPAQARVYPGSPTARSTGAVGGLPQWGPFLELLDSSCQHGGEHLIALGPMALQTSHLPSKAKGGGCAGAAWPSQAPGMASPPPLLQAPCAPPIWGNGWGQEAVGAAWSQGRPRAPMGAGEVTAL